MFPLTTTGGGTCLAFPDVCKTPAPPAPFVPVPYPDTGMCNQANKGTCSSKVTAVNQSAMHESSVIPMTSGDEAGSIGGMMSNMMKGQCAYKMGSMSVTIEGKKAVHIGSMTGQNGNNANMPAGAQIVPSQVKVLVAF